MRLVWGRVLEVAPESGGAQPLVVSVGDSQGEPALAYPRLTGACSPGEHVLLNTTAVDLGLGTGGVHFVVARRSGGSPEVADAAQDVILDEPSGGHIMKLRYTPLQVDVEAVEEPDGEHYPAMSTATSLEGMPVVCCGLHSQMPLVAAAVKQLAPDARVAYCHTDFGSLPYSLSAVAGSCREAGLIDVAISCGQSFGADLEAINLHSGLLAARHVARAHVAIVSIGPGMVGTATPFGHGGIAQGEAINAAYVLGADPIAALRVSFADTRERHRVLSHHTVTALARVALAPAIVAVPALPAEQAAALDAALEAAGVWELHQRADATRADIPRDALRGVTVMSMGRGIDDDPAFFASAYAAGEVAVARLTGQLGEG
jgi:Protein of unknown function (DUF3866)